MPFEEKNLGQLDKRGSTPADLDARSALIGALQAVPAETKKLLWLSARDVAAMTDFSAKKLQRARTARDAALVAGQPIDPLDPASIPFSAPSPGKPAALYPAQPVEDYLTRVLGSAKRGAAGEVDPSLAPTLAFQRWLTMAEPADVWPFSIQEDGSPMDMVAAVLADALTGEAEALTVREFGERAADAASKRLTRREKAEFEAIARPAPKATRRDDEPLR